jgi:hypothetical protein
MSTLLLFLLLCLPNDDFARGVQLRADREAAKQAFAEAARGYAEVWRQGDTSASNFSNWARAAELAGQRAEAIQAMRLGLRIHPTDWELKRDLLQLRELVGYPRDVNPPPLPAWSSRVGEADRYVLFLFSVILLLAGAVWWFTTRRAVAWWLIAPGLLGLVFVLVSTLMIQAELRQPVVSVIARPIILRTGNGPSYPARLPTPLNPGTEVRRLHERGGWVQVELDPGVVGWVPGGVLVQEEGSMSSQ